MVPSIATSSVVDGETSALLSGASLCFVGLGIHDQVIGAQTHARSSVWCHDQSGQPAKLAPSNVTFVFEIEPKR
jgi:hypothetical protein